MLKNALRQGLIAVSGNPLAQRFLRRNVQISQLMMGIGGGSLVSSSGERVVFDVLQRRRRFPCCIFDVGANQGQFLGLALECLNGREFSVHCFEPGRATFDLLRANVRDDPRVHLNNFGLGRNSGTATLYYDRPGSGLASLTRRGLDHIPVEFGLCESVEVDTIDNYCSSHGIEAIDLLKLDIEGHELDALMGAQSMFASGAISLVTFEFGGCNIDTRSFFRDFWRFFNRLGMELFRITPTGFLFPIDSYREIDEQFMTTNFLAMKPA